METTALPKPALLTKVGVHRSTHQKGSLKKYISTVVYLVTLDVLRYVHKDSQSRELTNSSFIHEVQENGTLIGQRSIRKSTSQRLHDLYELAHSDENLAKAINQAHLDVVINKGKKLRQILIYYPFYNQAIDPSTGEHLTSEEVAQRVGCKAAAVRKAHARYLRAINQKLAKNPYVRNLIQGAHHDDQSSIME